MTTAETINIKGVFGEKVKLSDKVFGVSGNKQAESQAVRVFMTNQRKANAKTKTRSEVAKTTAKMYKQKGTGRARHGSYSAPIFVGGGIAFGPTGEQNYKLKMSKSMAKTALLTALNEKAVDKKVVVLTDMEKISGKTKDIVQVVKQLKLKNNKVLVVAGKAEEKIVKMFRNVNGVSVMFFDQLNTYSVLKNQLLLFTEKGLSEITK